MQPGVPGQPQWGQMPPVGQPGWGQQPRRRQRWQYGDGRPPLGVRLRFLVIRLAILFVVLLIMGVVGLAVTVGFDELAGRPLPGTSAAPSLPSEGPRTLTAPLGAPVTLTGTGEQVAVTVTRVINSATASDPLLGGAAAGDRLYAVQFRLSNPGHSAYSDDPTLEATVTDSAGKSYSGDFLTTVNGCPAFSSTGNLPPGSAEAGCVVFDVPTAATITSIRYASGDILAPQTAQWPAPKP